MEEPKALVAAADKLLVCPESLFQSEIKEEKTQKLDTVVFCYLTFTSRPLSLRLLSRNALAKIMGVGEKRRGAAFAVVLWGEHRTFYNDAGQGGGGGVERVGRRGKKDKHGGLHTLPAPAHHCFYP